MLNHTVMADTLTIERIYESPSLAGSSPRSLKVAPDGKRVTYLQGKQSDYERLDLWEYNIASGESRLLFDSDELSSGEETLSDEEKAVVSRRHRFAFPNGRRCVLPQTRRARRETAAEYRGL